jgi:hypothetical protein
MRLENEDGEWKATNWRDWFGRRCFFAGAAKQKGSLPDIVACCALPDKLAFAQLDSGEAWLLVTRDGKKERKGQISDLLEQREKGNIP